MQITNRKTAEHYYWKKVCDGWHFLQRDDLSIIVEKMPPNTSEDMHRHQKARQFFLHIVRKCHNALYKQRGNTQCRRRY